MGYHLSHGTSQDKSHGQSINVQKAFSNAMERPSGFLSVSLGDILGQNRACWAVRMVKEDIGKRCWEKFRHILHINRYKNDLWTAGRLAQLDSTLSQST